MQLFKVEPFLSCVFLRMPMASLKIQAPIALNITTSADRPATQLDKSSGDNHCHFRSVCHKTTNSIHNIKNS
jgi:hypothetical protein